MEEPVIPRKYTKSEIITMYCFWCIWSTIITTILSIMCDILPKHFVAHIMLQVLIYIIFYKMSKYTISKGMTANMDFYESDENASFDLSKRITDDMCNGVWPHRDYMNSNSVVSTQYRSLRDGS